MLVSIITKTETLKEVALPAFFKERTTLDPYFIAVLGENQVLKIDGHSMAVYSTPGVVNNDITRALTEYLPISESEYIDAYNRAAEFIAEQLFPLPINRKK